MVRRGGLVIVLAAACSRSPEAPRDAGAATLIAQPITSADAGPRLRSTRDLDASATRAVVPCRAIDVVGTPTLDSADSRSVAVGDALDTTWLRLGAAERLTAKAPTTGRELIFLGAARARPCVGGGDEAWLARGRFRSSRGTGESPGAEEWIVTPSTVVRYGAATLEVRVDTAGTRVVVQGGSAAALAEGGDAWQPIGPAAPFAMAPLSPKGAAKDDRCAKAASASRSLEDALQAPEATRAAGFGALAVRATEARLLARAACAIARLRLEEEERVAVTRADAGEAR